MDDDDKLLFLLSGSFIGIPESYVKLRSYYNVHSANVARKQNLKLPKYLGNQNFTCPYCYLPWNPATSSFKLLPAKKLSADEKRKNKSDTSKDENEIKEASLPKNKLVLMCKICGNKTSFPLKKKSKTSEVEVEVEETLVTKKKKKKDKACGLKPKFVTSVQKTKTQSTTPAINQKNKTNLNNSKATQNTCQSSIKNSAKSKVPGQNKNKNHNSIHKKLVINPHAVQNQHKISMKNNNKKRQQLIQAVKEDTSIKKTLKGFLSLINSVARIGERQYFNKPQIFEDLHVISKVNV